MKIIELKERIFITAQFHYIQTNIKREYLPIKMKYLVVYNF